MKVTLEEIIQSIYPLPQQVLEDVLEHFQHLEYPKNYFLLKPGKPCKYLWFMIEGAVRYFYTNEQGKEINTWFSLDTQIITDTTSFVHQEPAQESIQLIENCELCAIEYSALQTLLQKHHSFAKSARHYVGNGVR
ncbi:MAG: Crp/Fnr family transcriptional regulator, partial [Crocinitomicaceae bacterium]|nr:Crp/Fnr family transcriptional regulator [Crocinitomicaceae bacterium]